MECNTSKEVDSYDFFKNIENYLDKANKAELSTSADGGFSDCVGFSETYSSSFKDKLIAKSVCEEIIKLYKSLHQFNSKSSCSNHKNDCDFFNYWVNYKISKSIINDSDCVERIYNYFESQCLNDFGIPLDVGIIYNIHTDDLKKLNKLYNLYAKYTKISAILKSWSVEDKEQLLSLSTQCCYDYIEASYICNDDNRNSKFCQDLNTFKNNYEKLYTQLGEEGSEISNSFKKLTECGNTRIIATAILGSVAGIIPLMGGLYKFTPIGQIFRPKNRNITKGHRNNGDEMRNISLMEHEREELRIHQGPYNIKYQSV